MLILRPFYLLISNMLVFSSLFKNKYLKIKINGIRNFRLFSSKAWSKINEGKTISDDFLPEVPTIKLEGKFNEVTIDQEEYLFGKVNYFKDFEMNSDLKRALESIGKSKATSIQALAFSTIKSGKDTLIASETGSGKTLAYLLPIIDRILGDPNFASDSKYPDTVIIVPNKELCSQVYNMAKEILAALKTQGRVLTIDIAGSYNGVWPYLSQNISSPNFLVCTPTYLGNYIKGPNILNEELFLNVKTIILDEADMILEGDYQKHIEKIMNAFKVVRRGLIKEGKIKIHEIILQKVLSAATLPNYGLRSTEKYIQKFYPKAIMITNTHMHKHHPRIKQNFIQIPSEAEILNSPLRIKMLLKEIDNIDSNKFDDRNGIMIFLNTAESAMVLAAALRSEGVSCVEFHKLVPNNEKEEQLRLFRSGEVPIFICTDHAARGLDLPRVYHVIQAEFALNVVAHLHRIGRASRAGNMGLATNFYSSSSNELVQSIIADKEEGKIEQSFSRRRGFRAKIKKVARLIRQESENPNKNPHDHPQSSSNVKSDYSIEDL